VAAFASTTFRPRLEPVVGLEPPVVSLSNRRPTVYKTVNGPFQFSPENPNKTAYIGLAIAVHVFGVVSYHDSIAACFVSEFVGICPATISQNRRGGVTLQELVASCQTARAKKSKMFCSLFLACRDRFTEHIVFPSPTACSRNAVVPGCQRRRCPSYDLAADGLLDPGTGSEPGPDACSDRSQNDLFLVVRCVCMTHVLSERLACRLR